MIRTSFAIGLLALAPALAWADAEPAVNTAAPATKMDARDEAHANRHCLRETGTRIKLRKGQCVTATGTVVTREDLGLTGEVDLGRALQKRLPSVR